jgi:hypothetical protein
VTLRSIILKAAGFWFSLVLADYLTVYFFGAQFWSYAGYFFGNNTTITLAVLVFVEGAMILTLGLVWASGAMETVFQGSNLQTNPYYRQQDWRQRKEQTQKQNEAGKILILGGAPILLVSFILLIL